MFENKLEAEGFDVKIGIDIQGLGRVLTPTELSTKIPKGNTDLSKRLPFENYLYITYTKEKEAFEYTDSKKIGGSQYTSVSKFGADSQLSWISMLEGFNDIEFEESGYIYNPVSLYSSGYWSFEKIAEMVPINYRPGADLGGK